MQVRIKGYTFSISEPFQPGDIITKAEAQALNDLRAENIQNNTRTLVNGALEGVRPNELIPQKILENIQREISKYDAEYSFKEKPQVKERLGDIEAEALVVARELIESEARREDIFLTEEQIEQLVPEKAKLPLVIEAARDRVQAKRKAISGGLEVL